MARRAAPAGAGPPAQDKYAKGEKLFVAARCRPLLKREHGQPSCLDLTPGQLSLGGRPLVKLADPKQTKVFDTLHAVIDSRTQAGSQEVVFGILGQQLIANANEGVNCCLFAYGQTGTGKSHTLVGPLNNEAQHGILPRVCREIFTAMPGVKVTCNFVELYNDDFRDLLAHPEQHHNKKLPKVSLHSNPKLGTYLLGHTELASMTGEELIDHCKYGCSMRSIASTAMNAQSSRGHSIFTIRCEKSDGVHAQIFIVDLAGHENEKTTKVTGDRMRELSFINSTLFHLREVVSALADKCTGRKKGVHVPYRNSKLTTLLEPAMEGRGRCSTVITLTPSANSAEENMHTLRFAQALSDIKTKPQPPPQTKADMLAAALAEIESLKAQLTQLQGGPGQRPMSDPSQLDKLHADLATTKVMAQWFRTGWTQVREETAGHVADRHEALARLGLLREQDGGPCLVNLSDDAQLQGAVLFAVNHGSTVVGSDPGEGGITVKGVGVAAEMLRLERGPKFGSTDEVVEAVPLPRDDGSLPRVLVNGLRLKRPVVLKHNDRLLVGCIGGFRFVNPEEIGAQHAEDHSLQDALAEVADDAGEAQALAPWVDYMRAQVGELRALAFLKQMHHACALVDEANHLSQAVRLSDFYKFSVQVLLDMENFQNGAAPEFLILKRQRTLKKLATNAMHKFAKGANALVGAAGQLAHEQLDDTAVWTLSKFHERLVHMRDVYVHHERGEPIMQELKNDPLSDPWVDVDQQGKNEELAAALSEKNREVQRLKQELEAHKAAGGPLGDGLAEDNARLRADVRRLEQQEPGGAALRQAQAENADLRERLEANGRGPSSLPRSDGALQRELERCERENQELRAKLDEQKHAAQRARAQLEELDRLAEEVEAASPHPHTHDGEHHRSLVVNRQAPGVLHWHDPVPVAGVVVNAPARELSREVERVVYRDGRTPVPYASTWAGYRGRSPPRSPPLPTRPPIVPMQYGGYARY